MLGFKTFGNLMTDLIKMEPGKGVYVLTLHRFPCFGASEAVCSTTYYLPSRMSVRLMVKMYQAEYGYRLSDFTLRYFNTRLIVSKDCDAPHFNIIDVDVQEAIQ